MCGIVYGKRFDGISAKALIEKRYRDQKDRGNEGFGFVALEGGKVSHYARKQYEGEIMAELEAKQSSEVLFHHRFPTSAPNFAETAHPIKISNESLKYDYYFVHNGIVFNDEALKKEHEAKGFKYSTEICQKWKHGANIIEWSTQWNDSEALGIEVALAIESGADKISVRGSIAFICLQVKKNNSKAVKLFFGRNESNPLKFEHQKGQFMCLSSEGYGNNIEVDTLYAFDYETYKTYERVCIIGDSYKSEYHQSDWEKGYNEHYGFKPDNEFSDNDYCDLVAEKGRLESKILKAEDKNDENELAFLWGELEDIEEQLAEVERQMKKQSRSSQPIF